MSYVRTKEIPVGSGHYYSYRVHSERDGDTVRQIFEEYLGRASGKGGKGEGESIFKAKKIKIPKLAESTKEPKAEREVIRDAKGIIGYTTPQKPKKEKKPAVGEVIVTEAEPPKEKPVKFKPAVSEKEYVKERISPYKDLLADVDRQLAEERLAKEYQEKVSNKELFTPERPPEKPKKQGKPKYQTGEVAEALKEEKPKIKKVKEPKAKAEPPKKPATASLTSALEEADLIAQQGTTAPQVTEEETPKKTRKYETRQGEVRTFKIEPQKESDDAQFNKMVSQVKEAYTPEKAKIAREALTSRLSGLYDQTIVRKGSKAVEEERRALEAAGFPSSQFDLPVLKSKLATKEDFRKAIDEATLFTRALNKVEEEIEAESKESTIKFSKLSEPVKPEPTIKKSQSYKLPPEINKYVKSIENTEKKDYAQKYAHFLTTGDKIDEPQRGKLSAIDAQEIRREVYNLQHPEEKTPEIQTKQKPQEKSKAVFSEPIVTNAESVVVNAEPVVVNAEPIVVEAKTKIEEPKEESLHEGVQLEGGLFGGAYNVNRLRFAEKDASIRKTIKSARAKYNDIRVKQGLDKITDWSKRPENTLEQIYRKQTTKETEKPVVTPEIKPQITNNEQVIKALKDKEFYGTADRLERGEITLEQAQGELAGTLKPKVTIKTILRTANAADVIADIKHRGFDKQTGYGQFVKARALQPEMNMKEFSKIYDSVSAKQFTSESSEVVESTPEVKPEPPKEELRPIEEYAVTPKPIKTYASEEAKKRAEDKLQKTLASFKAGRLDASDAITELKEQEIEPPAELFEAETPEGKKDRVAQEKADAESEKVRSMLSDFIDDEKKSQSIKKIEKVMAGLDYDKYEGLEDIESAIEDYRSLERSGMSPKEYNDEKATLFEEITSAIESVEAVIDEEDEEEPPPEVPAEPVTRPPQPPASGGVKPTKEEPSLTFTESEPNKTASLEKAVYIDKSRSLGDDIWNETIDLLIEKHSNEPDYSPTNDEVREAIEQQKTPGTYNAERFIGGGLKAKSVFDGGSVEPDSPYAYRSMGEDEYKRIIVEGAEGGRKGHKGGWWAQYPYYSQSIKGTKNKPKYLVEVNSGGVYQEGLNNSVSPKDITGIWVNYGRDKEWERVELPKIIENPPEKKEPAKPPQYPKHLSTLYAMPEVRKLYPELDELRVKLGKIKTLEQKWKMESKLVNLHNKITNEHPELAYSSERDPAENMPWELEPIKIDKVSPKEVAVPQPEPPKATPKSLTLLSEKEKQIVLNQAENWRNPKDTDIEHIVEAREEFKKLNDEELAIWLAHTRGNYVNKKELMPIINKLGKKVNKNELPPDIPSWAEKAIPISRDSEYHDYLKSDAQGVWEGSRSNLDKFLSPDASDTDKKYGKNIYNEYEPVRQELKNTFGNTIKLYRAVKKDGEPESITTNYMDTKEGAERYLTSDRKIVEAEIPVDNIVAVYTSDDGKYREIRTSKYTPKATPVVEKPTEKPAVSLTEAEKRSKQDAIGQVLSGMVTFEDLKKYEMPRSLIERGLLTEKDIEQAQ